MHKKQYSDHRADNQRVQRGNQRQEGQANYLLAIFKEIIQNFGDRSLLSVQGSFSLYNTVLLNLVRNDLGLNFNPFANHLGRCQPRWPRQLAGLRPKKSVNLQTVLLNQSEPHKFSTNAGRLVTQDAV